MPTALRGFGGLGFLRSRSAPPTRDQEQEANDEKSPHSPNMSDAETHAADSAPATKPTHAQPLARPTPLSTVTSPMIRTASPTLAAPLEAVLLERKRRIPAALHGAPSVGLSATGPSVGGSTSAVPAAGAKGSRFKSSPLGDVERIGTVVVERVKEDEVEEGGNDARD